MGCECNRSNHLVAWAFFIFRYFPDCCYLAHIWKSLVKTSLSWRAPSHLSAHSTKMPMVTLFNRPMTHPWDETIQFWGLLSMKSTFSENSDLSKQDEKYQANQHPQPHLHWWIVNSPLLIYEYRSLFLISCQELKKITTARLYCIYIFSLFLILAKCYNFTPLSILHQGIGSIIYYTMIVFLTSS